MIFYNKKIISVIFLIVLTVGCKEQAKYDLNQKGVIITGKYQNYIQKHAGSATYTFHAPEWGFGQGQETALCLDENFGNVGQIVIFTNGMMKAIDNNYENNR